MKFNKSFKMLIGLVLLVVLAMPGYKVDEITAKKNDDATSPKRLTRIVNDLTPKNWSIYDEINLFTPENLYGEVGPGDRRCVVEIVR